MSDEITTLLRFSDVTSWLNLAPFELKRLLRKKQIPHIKLPSGDTVFDRAELLQWLDAHKQRVEFAK